MSGSNWAAPRPTVVVTQPALPSTSNSPTTHGDARQHAGVHSATSVKVRPRYFHRLADDDAELLTGAGGGGGSEAALSRPQQQSLLTLQSRPSMVRSGALLVENERHRSVEADPEMLKNLVRQRRLILKCVVAVTAVVLAIILAWLILPSVRDSVRPPPD